MHANWLTPLEASMLKPSTNTLIVCALLSLTGCVSNLDDVANPDAPINLIDLEDCIGIILKILATDTWNTTLNAVTPFHPTRKDYYTQKALEEKLIPPSFNHENPSIGKTILSDYLIEKLNYTFTKNPL